MPRNEKDIWKNLDNISHNTQIVSQNEEKG
jgi:hypothetical protein